MKREKKKRRIAFHKSGGHRTRFLLLFTPAHLLARRRPPSPHSPAHTEAPPTRLSLTGGAFAFPDQEGSMRVPGRQKLPLGVLTAQIFEEPTV